MLARGPVVLGIDGLTLDAVDRERLLHPLVGGVILFSRNYDNVEQLAALTAQIHAMRTPALLAEITTWDTPGVPALPEICPVVVSIVQPSGKPLAPYWVGVWLAAI